MGRTENLIDPPITEKDAQALHVFYEQFLNKDEHDALSFLKAVVLLRRGDLREFVHNFALLRKRLQVMIREQRQRALILSFPSTIQRVHELVWEGQEAYGEDGSTVMTILGTQASDYLDQTEMFRLDLDSLLSDCPSMLPEDLEALKQSVAAGVGTHLFLLIALADHYLVTLLPYDHAQPTEAVLRARTFLEKKFGEKAEDQIIEFFVIGGGYLRIAAGRIVLCGVHAVFDPAFADPGQPETDRLIAEFRRCKFQLALEALRAELPDQSFVIQG
jgi:hypothetical protein